MERQKGISQINYEKTKHQLAFQEQIRKGNTRITGPCSSEFNNILTHSDNILESLLETEEGQKNFHRIYELTHNLGISEKEMKNSYLDGLRYNLKAGYRLGFFKTTSDTSQLTEQLISSYTLSFRQTLRSFDIQKDHHQEIPNLILSIAKKSYLLKPDIYQDLKAQYQGDNFVDDGIIKRFVVSNPSNPQQAIETAKKTYIQLIDQYQGDDFVDDSIIKHFVVHNPSNPQQAIETAKKTYIQLIDQYQSDDFVDDGIIKRFVVYNPTNPQQAIETAKKTYLRLKDQYQGDDFVDDRMIKYFVVYNPTNPQQAIETAKKTYIQLIDQYQGDDFVDDSIIKHFVVYNRNNPQQAIETTKKLYFELKDQYQDVSNTTIKFAVVMHPGNYKEYLDSLKQ